MWTGIGGGKPSPPQKRSGWPTWWLILLIILFPIPFGPWWLTIICLAVFCVLVVLITPKKEK
jgi:hypothetical protein